MKLSRIFTFLLVACVATANAQTLTSKSGRTILPEEGDYAIGFDADPFLNYVGNFLGDNFNSAPFAGNVNNTIYVKKFLTSTTAVSARLNLQKSGYSRIYHDVRDDAAATDPTFSAQVSDQAIQNSYFNVIGADIEKRKGDGRIQGFCGTGLTVGFGGQNQSYVYGNAMSSTNQTPSSFNGSPGTRTIEYSDRYFNVGAQVFTGVEFFFAPKISVQGRLGWAINYQFDSEGTGRYETVIGGEYTEYTRNTSNDQFNRFNYNIFGSDLVLLFHF